MDFDQMLEAWRAQNTAPPYDVNREALRQALEAEEARVRRELRLRRRGIWFCWVLAGGMAVWAGFWIAITIANGWPAIYAVAAGVSFAIFALGIGLLWMSRGRPLEPERNFDNTLEEELRRGLEIVDRQLSVVRHWVLFILGTACIVIGFFFFSWTINKSQGIPDTSYDGRFPFLLMLFIVWLFYKARNQVRKANAILELRQQRLRELLAALEARE